jgi:hypothetical protein
MSSDQKKIVPINYTNREFEGIRQDLLELAERLYPDSFQDFSEASFGSLMIDSVAYVGDQLSFYMDYNINESFLDTAYQYNNVLRMGRTMGYKHTGRPSTYGTAAIFVIVPASPTGIGPDTNYIPVLKRGTRFSSDNNLNFVLLENIDFSDPKNPVVVAKVNTTTGAPTSFAIKSYGNVVSGYFSRTDVVVGAYERFKRIKLPIPELAEIISVFDSQGNEFYEVDYLSQDMIFKEVTNKNYKNDNVPSILKPFLVSRKFIVERDRNNAYLQFGSGQIGDSEIVADPQTVVMEIFGKNYTSDTTFDPTRLSKNKSLGIVPSNTTLSISYRVTNPSNSNVAVGSLNRVGNALFDFEDRSILNSTEMGNVIASLEISNEEPITGDVTNANTSEIKRRIFDTFPTQNRAVTQADYENLSYRMPAKFGSIKRVSAQRDPDSKKRNLNMYVISEDSFGKLVSTNKTIKNNLKTWLNQHRMINDTLDIIDPYIINYGIEFIIKPSSGADKYITLNSAVEALKERFKAPMYIGEPIYISDIYSTLKESPGVLDVIKVRLINKTGTNYSNANIDINKNLSPNGDYLIIPKNAIAEMKYPESDIQGKIR